MGKSKSIKISLVGLMMLVCTTVMAQVTVTGTVYDDYGDPTIGATVREKAINCFNCFNELGIPFIFGEFGAIDEEKNMSERVKYATYIATKMLQYNTAGLWWMGLYDRSNHERYEQEIVNALFSVK